jgi:Domain of unknown function (DUF397)
MTPSMPHREPAWRKTRHSVGGNGACVEVASFDGCIGVRDSKDPGGNVMKCPTAQWRSFTYRINGSVDRY